MLLLILTLESRSGLPRSTDRVGEFGMCCLRAKPEFHSPPARLSIAGNPKGKHAGALSFGYFSLSKQSKSNSPMMGEKHESIQEY